MILGAGEIVVVLAVALMVLGPQKMPEVARTIARFVAQLRRVADEVKSQVEDALNDPPAQPSRPGTPQPTLPPATSEHSPHDAEVPSGDVHTDAPHAPPKDPHE